MTQDYSHAQTETHLSTLLEQAQRIQGVAGWNPLSKGNKKSPAQSECNDRSISQHKLFTEVQNSGLLEDRFLVFSKIKFLLLEKPFPPPFFRVSVTDSF